MQARGAVRQMTRYDIMVNVPENYLLALFEEYLHQLRFFKI